MCMLAKKLNTTTRRQFQQHPWKRHIDKRQNNKRASTAPIIRYSGPRVCRLRNVKQVRYQATHQVTRLVAIIIRETHALVCVKQAFSILLSMRAPMMSPANNKVAAQSGQIHHDKDGNKYQAAKNDVYLRKQSLVSDRALEGMPARCNKMMAQIVSRMNRCFAERNKKENWQTAIFDVCQGRCYQNTGRRERSQ